MEKRVEGYHGLIGILVDKHKPVAALSFAERAKGRTLLDALQSGVGNPMKAMTSIELETERKLNAEVVSVNTQLLREKQREPADQARLAELNARLQKARLEYEAFEINLYTAHPELRVHRRQMQPISLGDAGRLIPDTNTALLEFVVAEDKTHLFVLTSVRASAANSQRQHRP